MSIPQCIFQKSQIHSVNDSVYDFHWVCLEIPVENCIVGMLLTCPFVDILIWVALQSCTVGESDNSSCPNQLCMCLDGILYVYYLYME